VDPGHHSLENHQQLSIADRDIFVRLSETESFPYIPNNIIKTLEAIENEHATSYSISEQIREDPFMAGRIIEMANIRKSARTSNITAIDHAISFIGLNGVTEIVMAAFLSTIKLKTKEFDQKIRLKLIEEAQEVSTAQSRDDLILELVDMYEVIDFLIKLHSITQQEIKTAQTKKYNDRGGFASKKFVETAEHPVGSFGEKYCLADPEKYPELIKSK